MGDIKRMRGDVEGARRCYASAVVSIEGEGVCCIPPPAIVPCFSDVVWLGAFGSNSFHLIDPIMLCAAAYAEMGDGDGALHR
jgi:hypothetical protein